jgi:hypothetical protein
MATLAEIYNWFMTGKKPTESQFRASWGSFWHKSEKIPINVIDGLTGILNNKTENSQFEAHKVAADAHQALFDLKENKNQKGSANGYAPLNEFTKIAAQYLDIVNDLTTGGTTALASAEMVKSLKIQIEAIQTLLSSDNINLDTVQEIVDAIETVQSSLSTILVNDLTTGGTTKALTAEMGKVLKGLIDSTIGGIADVMTKSTDQTVTATKFYSVYQAFLSWIHVGGVIELRGNNPFAYGYGSNFPTIGNRDGNIGVYSAQGSHAAYFDTKELTSFYRTYTFPDNSGVFALMEDVSFNIPLEINSNLILTDAHSGRIIILTASVTVTIPNGLQDGFNCSFVTLTGVTLTFSLGGSVVLVNNIGTTLGEKMSCTIQRRAVNNSYITFGAL